MRIKENIYSVRAVDSEIRMFHGYQTPIGTTYNAYLVVDDKITLIDFVRSQFSDTLIDNIKAVIGDRPVDYIICNHVEPDHSGALPAVIAAYPSAVIFGTANCQKGLKAYYPDCRYDFVPVNKGDTLSTGRYTFGFMPMPMVHWPDSMSTYLREEKILFSNDALGQHIGTGEMFDDELPVDKLFDRAQDYYANIVLPFDIPVKKLLESAASLEIDVVCPSHGVILKRHISQMIAKYAGWCENKTDDKKTVIIYDTMWGTTRKLAEKLRDECTQKGYHVETINLSEKHHSYAMGRLLDAKYIFVGSPTLNNQVMPTISAFLTYMKGLRPKNRVGLAFGSYGWSGESVGHINDILSSCGFEMLEPVKTMWNV